LRKLHRNAYLDIRGQVVSHRHSDATALRLRGDVKCHRTPIVSPCERATLCQLVETLRPLRQVGPSDDVFDLPDEETALDHELDVEVVMRRQHARGCPTKHTDYDTGSPDFIDEPNEVERVA
jgi:hypothetical protein